MASTYWARVLRNRVARRRALVAAGATALGAGLLAACGGDGQDTQDSSGTLSVPRDTSDKAVPGGVWPTASGEPRNLDPHSNTRTPDSEFYSIVYSNLLKFGRTTDGTRPPVSSISGDAAETFELSPDGMLLTLKLRSNHKFDPRPPTNGRAMTTADVKYSWDRTAALSPFALEMFNSKSEFGPVDSLTTPDDKTVVIKLAFPYRSILEMLAYHTFFWVLPQEAEQFNTKAEARGSGPFFLQEWQPSRSVVYTKNPDWYVKGRPFLDGITYVVLADYPTSLAQFESAAIWDHAVNQQDVLRVKRDHPEMVMSRNLRYPAGTNISHFMMASSRSDSPLRDVRVRQATAMLIDRDLVIDTLYNVTAFRQAGVPQETYWNSHLGGATANWIDPKTDAIGEGGKFFQFNPPEAKKLLSAAGYDGSQPLDYFGRGTGAEITPLHLTVGQMLMEGGLKLNQQGLDTNTEWRQRCQATDTIGEGWSGWCHQSSGAFNDAEHLASKYTPEGKFRMTYREIPKITDLARKARLEIDDKRQSDLIKQIQREMAVLWLDMPMPGYADTYDLIWPWLKNYGVFTEGGYEPNWSSSRIRTEYWYDASAKKA